MNHKDDSGVFEVAFSTLDGLLNKVDDTELSLAPEPSPSTIPEPVEFPESFLAPRPSPYAVPKPVEPPELPLATEPSSYSTPEPPTEPVKFSESPKAPRSPVAITASLVSLPAELLDSILDRKSVV